MNVNSVQGLILWLWSVSSSVLWWTEKQCLLPSESLTFCVSLWKFGTFGDFSDLQLPLLEIIPSCVCFLRKLEEESDVRWSGFMERLRSAGSNQTTLSAMRAPLIPNPRLPTAPIDRLFVRRFERKTVLFSDTAERSLSLSHCVLIMKTKRLFRENDMRPCGWRKRRWRKPTDRQT